MYEQTLYKVLDDHIKPHTVAKINKAKKWEYGYNEDYDVVVISKTGEIGEIYEIQNLKIALPKAKNIHKFSSDKWEYTEYPKELKKIKRGSKEFIKELDLEKSKMNIQRFKGLGEMNPEELWSTTLDPETRNLLQVQYSKDLKKDQSLIHTLMGNDVALRKDFIVSNAINVRNLDI